MSGSRFMADLRSLRTSRSLAAGPLLAEDFVLARPRMGPGAEGRITSLRCAQCRNRARPSRAAPPSAILGGEGRLRQPGRSSHAQPLDPDCRIGDRLREDAVGGIRFRDSEATPCFRLFPAHLQTGVCGGGDGNGRKAGLPPERIL